MARTVFILGAGASKQGGAPLMGEFLDAADTVWKTGRVGSADNEHFERVFRAVGRLQQVHSKHGSLDLVNIESVFAAFEMARMIGRLPGLTPDEIEALVPSMRRLIVRTLELTLPFGQGQEGLTGPPPYDEFVTLLRDLAERAKPPHTVAILTFNYDIALDFAIASKARNRSIFYALQQGPPEADSITLLKLHGSVNWFVCGNNNDQRVVAWPVLEAISGAVPVPLPDRRMLYSFDYSKCKLPEHRASNGPVIVPPTWSKGEYHRQLSNVWRRAAQELSEAENVIVIGYSLPPSDNFFPLLFGLGTVGDNPLRRFWVFDPDQTVGSRFEAMLGPGARQRFQAFSKLTPPGTYPGREPDATFSHAIGEVRRRLGCV